MIRLQDVNECNWRLDLHVSQIQKQYVSNGSVMLARAYAYRNSRSSAFIIYNDKNPVGMVLYYDIDELKAYDFSQLFIDEKYQGQGYGSVAAQMVLELMKKDGKYGKVILCYIEGNEGARRLYEKLGFKITDRDEDEIIMEKML